MRARVIPASLIAASALLAGCYLHHTREAEPSTDGAPVRPAAGPRRVDAARMDAARMDAFIPPPVTCDPRPELCRVAVGPITLEGTSSWGVWTDPVWTGAGTLILGTQLPLLLFIDPSGRVTPIAGPDLEGATVAMSGAWNAALGRGAIVIDDEPGEAVVIWIDERGETVGAPRRIPTGALGLMASTAVVGPTEGGFAVYWLSSLGELHYALLRGSSSEVTVEHAVHGHGPFVATVLDPIVGEEQRMVGIGSKRGVLVTRADGTLTGALVADPFHDGLNDALRDFVVSGERSYVVRNGAAPGGREITSIDVFDPSGAVMTHLVSGFNGALVDLGVGGRLHLSTSEPTAGVFARAFSSDVEGPTEPRLLTASPATSGGIRGTRTSNGAAVVWMNQWYVPHATGPALSFAYLDCCGP